ncbi:MAG: Rne/Rng family ribonuclease [Clostridiales bacterium]|nr:Rne/Rng family ribonuclease [Clostridiales bacterium]
MKPRLNDNAEKTILVDVNPYRTRVMLLEDGVPVEFYIERRDKERLVGNIYKGKVQNVLPGMYAAFININAEKNAFLYAGDIKPDSLLNDEVQIEGKFTPSMICDVVRSGQDILVQIVKEPIGTKGARATTQISLPGRNVVFLPTVDFIGISKRISKDEERKRLKAIVSEVLPEGTGVIVRTAAEGLDEESIRADLVTLVEEWERIKARYRASKAPALIHKDDALIIRTVRDLFTGNVGKMIVNEREHFELLRSLVPADKRDKVEFYDDEKDLFVRYGAEKALDEALSRRVWLKSGAYIVIDRTEALTSIDVNTGKYVGSVSLGRTIVETNKEAAFEIARQLRLRDIGGIVIIDFIDMESEEDRRAVIDTLTEALRCDSTKTVVLGMTALGLVEVTRKKLSASISATLQRECPYCKGTGLVPSSQTTALNIRRDVLERMAFDKDVQGYVITAVPSVAELLEKYIDEEKKNTPALDGISITIKGDAALGAGEYHIKNI